MKIDDFLKEKMGQSYNIHLFIDGEGITGGYRNFENENKKFMEGKYETISTFLSNLFGEEVEVESEQFEKVLEKAKSGYAVQVEAKAKEREYGMSYEMSLWKMIFTLSLSFGEDFENCMSDLLSQDTTEMEIEI